MIRTATLTGDGTRTMAYDVENRLLSVSGGGPGLSLTYDPLGRLRQSTSGSSVIQFLYDGDRLAAEYSGAGTLLRRYAHGPGIDEPVVWYEGSGLTTRNFLHADERGSVVASSNNSGVGTPYSYGPYGEPNNWNLVGTASRFRYTGQIVLPEAFLYHYKARVYDPNLGRFLQTDPVGYQDVLNLYAYARNEPIGRTDPSGMETWFWGGAGNSDEQEYKRDFVASMQEAGLKNVRAVPEAATSPGGIIADLATLPLINNVTDFRIFTEGVRPSDAASDQYNLVGYSYGTVAAAQQALSDASSGIHVDNLVMIGAPINQDLLDAVQSSPNIATVTLIDMKWDPVKAGGSDLRLAITAPVLAAQMVTNTGHFYYAGANQIGAERRRELARKLYTRGLR